jgi:electron transport complex protein RnfD
LFHILTGNVMIGAFFLSTDHASSPVNRWGMVVYGIGCGAMTVILRSWSTYPDGVVFACLLMGLFVPLLDKLKARQIVPRPVETTALNIDKGEKTIS